MNERMLELAKQSGMRSPDLFKLTVSHMTTDTLEKFALLILSECLELFEAAKVNQEDDVDYGLEEAKNIIKEHFGVEE